VVISVVKAFDILGIGCVSVDDLLYVPGSYPVADTKTRVLSWDRQCGGLTATALVAAARLGAKCAFAGLLGLDDLSPIVEASFEREGVDISHAPRANDAPVPHAVIIVAAETRTRNIFYRIDGRIGADDNLPDESVIRSARILFLDQYGMTGCLRAATIARNAGIPIVADFEDSSDPLFPQLLRLINHVVLPQDIAEKITGENRPETAAKALWHPGCQAVVITAGTAGSWFLGKEGVVRHQPAYKVEAVDTTGCGDVFHGAYAAALVQGASLDECVRLATAAAGLKATQPGGQRGIPTRAQVEGFLGSGPASC
jgi:sulfofructose kinase